MISVIITARNERYLFKTLDDIYRKFMGKFEVVVILDGRTEYTVKADHPNLTVIHMPMAAGVRPSLNKAVSASKGDYLLKLDAHCAVGEGFDEKLRRYCKEDMVMVARRYTLDLDTWERTPRIVDYYYLSCPWTHPHGMMMQSCPWISFTEANMDTSTDDLMCFQGSMWMMSRAHWNWLGGLEEGIEEYAEHHEISMKTWLGGRRVVVNKEAWYAHPKESVRGYHMSMDRVYQDHDHSARYWTENRWEGRVHDFDWLIDKFWPLPTYRRHRLEKYYWPEDWKKYYDATV